MWAEVGQNPDVGTNVNVGGLNRGSSTGGEVPMLRSQMLGMASHAHMHGMVSDAGHGRTGDGSL